MVDNDAPRVLRTAPLVRETPEGLKWLRIGSLAAGGEPVYERDAMLERLAGACMEPFYQDNLTTLYHGDCLEVMATLPDRSFDAIITDPPFGTTACTWDTVIPFELMWEQLRRLIRPRGAIVLFGSQPFTSALVMSNPEWFRYEWVWEKDKPTGFLDANRRPMRAHENISVFFDELGIYNPQKTIGHAPTNTPGRRGAPKSIYSSHERMPHGGNTDRYPRSVQRFNTVNSAHNPVHPTQKPLALLEYLVRTYTNEGDRVLDFTTGSATAPRACKNLKRYSVGIELLEQYCQVAVKRLQPVFEAALVDSGASLEDLPLFAQSGNEIA